MDRKLYQHIASSLVAMINCASSGNSEGYKRHRATIEALVADYMPSGSGIDSSTQFDFERSNANRLVFNTAFHHMDESGMYHCWTEHTIRVTPSFFGLDIAISGRNRNDIKDYLHGVFDLALGMTITEAEWRSVCDKAA